MDEYAESLEEIKVREGKSDEELTRKEMKVLRKYVGKLDWLPGNIEGFKGSKYCVEEGSRKGE